MPPTEADGLVYAINGYKNSCELVVKVGRKTFRLKTDEAWAIGEPVVVRVERKPRAQILDIMPESVVDELKEMYERNGHNFNDALPGR